jgi:hypothetical protein
MVRKNKTSLFYKKPKKPKNQNVLAVLKPPFDLGCNSIPVYQAMGSVTDTPEATRRTAVSARTLPRGMAPCVEYAPTPGIGWRN